jgi:hypothetical protein
MTGWPYPGDSPLARARRLAQAYRAALADTDPGACDQLDERARTWGETWIVPAVITHDLDDWLTPTQAADLACVDPAHLRTWRHRGRLTGRQRPDGGWEYQARDILELLTNRRRRPRQLRSTTTAPVRPAHQPPPEETGHRPARPSWGERNGEARRATSPRRPLGGAQGPALLRRPQPRGRRAHAR